ncbi:ribonuclease III [Dermacoccaceae bacterium W4C1]
MGSKRARQQEAAQRPVADLAGHLTEVSGTVIDEPLLLRALTHRSYAYENGGLPHNERQEFLGDAVLGLVVTDHLYAVHPDLPEGQLAKLRASVVNSRALAGVARELHLGEYILLGRGEGATGGRDKDSILADTTEAVIGTVYLTGGLEPSRKLVHHLLDELLESAAGLGAGLDWKTSLQEAVAAADLGSPMYRVSDTGPDHDKEFTAEVVVGEQVLGTGVGRNKKAAEQQAAEAAWKVLQARAEEATTAASGAAEAAHKPSA